MLIAFAPDNKMEAFFREGMRRRDNAYSNSGNPNDKESFRAYDMELLGPHYPWNVDCASSRAYSLWGHITDLND